MAHQSSGNVDFPFNDHYNKKSNPMEGSKRHKNDNINQNQMTHDNASTNLDQRILSEISSSSSRYTATSASSKTTISLDDGAAGSKNMPTPPSSYSVCTNTSILTGMSSNMETANGSKLHKDGDPDNDCGAVDVKDLKLSLQNVFIKVRDVINPCTIEAEKGSLVKEDRTTLTGRDSKNSVQSKKDSECVPETDANVKFYTHRQDEEPRHKSVTFHEQTIQANSPTSSGDCPAAAHGQDQKDQLSDNDDDDDCHNHVQIQEHKNAEERNESSIHSSATNYQTAHCNSRTFSQHSDKTTRQKSRSERFFDRHLRASSIHGDGNANAPTSNQSKSSLFAKLFVRSTRTRTVTTSRRSGHVLGALLREGDIGTSENSEASSSVLVDRRKGRSNFVHRVTAEALPHISFAGVKTDNNENTNTCTGQSVPDVTKDKSTSSGNTENEMPKLVSKGRADSVKKERRGRSFFRTKQRKRSHAKSPGPRWTSENGKVVGSATGTAAMGMSVSNIRWIRRESPSPKAAARKRPWSRKVISRAERDRRAMLKKAEGSEAASSTASYIKDTELKKKGCADKESNNGQSDHDSASRLLTLS